MPYHIQHLHYAIDDWHQLVNAKSNTDPTLKVYVSDFVDSMILQGIRISVKHPQYGVLFSALANANGRLVDSAETGLSNTDILQALRQLGFDVDFKLRPQVNSPTRVFLTAAYTAGYTHIRRILWRKSATVSRPIIVCFNEVTHPGLLNQNLRAIPIVDGNIMKVSPNSDPSLDFSWLFDVPLHIESILTNNIQGG